MGILSLEKVWFTHGLLSHRHTSGEEGGFFLNAYKLLQVNQLAKKELFVKKCKNKWGPLI
jgi:hypothetical protein